MDHSECFEVQNSKDFRGCAPKPPGGGRGTYNAPQLLVHSLRECGSLRSYARKLSGPQTNFRFHHCTLSRWKLFAGRRSCACRLQTFLSTTVRIPVVAVKLHDVYDYTVVWLPWQVFENHWFTQAM